jgi:hypothetical protein
MVVTSVAGALSTNEGTAAAEEDREREAARV